MDQTLIIGSTVVDVNLKIPDFPGRGKSFNIGSVEYSIGGCAFNVYKAMQLYKSPAILCSPVGTGIYGRMVRGYLEGEGIEPFASIEEENGCCYCLVKDNGERSYLSHHGAEYRFSRSWMKDIDFSNISGVYICGLEVEESDGNEIVDFVYEHPELDLYFAPSPRIMNIQSEKMERILSRRDGKGKGPLLHLNESEALRFTGKNNIKEAAESLANETENTVVITSGERGCYFLADGRAEEVKVFPVRSENTVGAGDAHLGALITCLKKGMDIKDACFEANKAGAAVVSIWRNFNVKAKIKYNEYNE